MTFWIDFFYCRALHKKFQIGKERGTVPLRSLKFSTGWKSQMLPSWQDIDIWVVNGNNTNEKQVVGLVFNMVSHWLSSGYKSQSDPASGEQFSLTLTVFMQSASGIWTSWTWLNLVGWLGFRLKRIFSTVPVASKKCYSLQKRSKVWSFC